MAMDLAPGAPEPDPARLKTLGAQVRKSGTELLILNCSSSHLPAWEPLLRSAQAITAASRAAAFALLDRFLACIELPAGPEGGHDPAPAAAALRPADRIHLGLLTASIQRRFGDRPSVSVVIPLYNTPPEYLRQTIRSVLGQDDPDWELVLVDNGDPAITGPVVAEFQDPRIRYYSGMGRRGVAMGRNLGNLLARGRFIAVMDHDDLCAPERVRTIKRVLSEQEGYLYSDVVQLFPGGKVELKRLSRPDPGKLRRETFIFNPAVAYPARLAREFAYDPRFEPVDDYHLILAMLRRNIKFIHLEQPLVHYRWHETQYSKAAAVKMLALAAGARAEDEYLRAGGDPRDREKRFERLVLSLMAYGCDREARELAELGYGPAPLRRAALAAGPAGKDGAAEALAAEPSPLARRQAAWLALKRQGESRAAAILADGIRQNLLGPRERSDLAELLMRTGEIEAARAELKEVLRENPGLALGRFLGLLLESGAALPGAAGLKPPALALSPASDPGLSVIVAVSSDDAGRLPATLAPLQRGGSIAEIIVIGPDAEAAPPRPSAGPAPRAINVAAAPPGALWNQGAALAAGSFLAFLRPGDAWAPEFAGQALASLRLNPEADAVLGEVKTPAGVKLPGRAIGVSPLLRDERALLCGCIWKREALTRIGGFIPGLSAAGGWELLIRAAKNLLVIQPGLDAGAGAREPLAPEFIFEDAGSWQSNLALFRLTKLIHSPLRYLDHDFSGAPREWLSERFAELDRIARRSPRLIELLDPWEYLSEFNDPHHLLYRLGRRLYRLGRFKDARLALREALSLKPREPKIWARLLLSTLRSLLA
ncbi:MAG TPA: glycosyltransferase [bacterium]|nr:glycosyltransferase [bacterium]